MIVGESILPSRRLILATLAVILGAIVILMPFYTRMEKTKPVPERVTG